MPRILIADDHPIVRRCVRRTLEDNGWEVCGEARTGREAVMMTAAQRPEFILTMHDMEELIPELRASGVRDCVLKTDLQQLVNAVQSAMLHNES
jgi:DNA-binding NarL/FixJ family response regulator